MGQPAGERLGVQVPKEGEKPEPTRNGRNSVHLRILKVEPWTPVSQDVAISGGGVFIEMHRVLNEAIRVGPDPK